MVYVTGVEVVEAFQLPLDQEWLPFKVNLFAASLHTAVPFSSFIKALIENFSSKYTYPVVLLKNVIL